MAIRAGLYTPSAESVAESIPSAESVAQSIENVPSTGEIAQSNQALLANMQATTDAIGYEPPDETPQVFYSPSTRKMFVNGLMFDDDDAKTALESVEKLKDRPLKPSRNVATDWSRVNPKDYGSYIKGIKNPQAGRLAAENFDIGGSNLKLLGGRAAQFFGAEETGQGWVDSAVRELEKNEPFQREFTNIKSGYISDGDANESHDAIDWFIANLAQQGPNLIESVGVALIGGLAGGVAGGNPFTAVGSAIAAVMGKASYKSAVIKAAKKYKKDKDSLSDGDKKLLREVSSLTAVAERQNPNKLMGIAVYPGYKKQVLKENKAKLDVVIDDGVPGAAQIIRDVGKGQAISGGAALGVGTSSYGIGLGDVYGEQREMGQDNRVSAALTAIPYAAMEMLPEFLLAARIFKVSPKRINKTLLEGTDQGGRTSRALKGFGVGGALEGTTEVAQESLILANTGQFDINSPEVGTRLINAFAAGFFVGGPIGGAANLLSKPSANILDPSNTNTEPPVSNPPLSGKEKLTAGTATLSGTTGDPAIGQQLPLPGIEEVTGRDKLATGTRKLNELEPAYETTEAPTESGQLPLPGIDTKKEINALEKIISKNENKKKGDQLELNVETPEATTDTNTNQEIKNAEIYADEELRSIPERDELVQETYADEELRTDKNVLEEIDALNNVIRDDTNKEIKKLNNILDGISTTTNEAPGKAKLTTAQKSEATLKAMKDEIKILDKTALSVYKFKSVPKVKGRSKTISDYLTTEELSNLLTRKLSRKVTLETTGKTNTAEYRNTVADIEAIQRYLQLLSVPLTIATDKKETSSGEEEETTGTTEEETTDVLPKTTEEINAVDRAKTKFDPREEPMLVNESTALDLPATRVKKTKEGISGGTEESNITDPDRRKNLFESIDYAQKNRGNITPEGLKELYGDILFNIMIIDSTMFLSYKGAHYKGGIVLNGSLPYSSGILPNLLAHELGHASHAYYGTDINNQSTIKDELKAIENYMYPGLREKILAAEKEGKNIDATFFNYLLSPEELIAEFNVNRILNPAETQPLAPIIYQALEAAQKQPDLVRKRKTFPDGIYPSWMLKADRNFDGDYARYNVQIKKANLKKGENNANKEQGTTEVVTGKQTRGGGKTLKGNAENSNTTNEAGTKKPVGKTETGKEKLRDKKEEDTTGQANEKPVTESSDSTRKNKVIEELLRQKEIDEIRRAREKPKDFKAKYKGTQEAWNNIKSLIPGAEFIGKIPRPISDFISTAVKESTVIDTKEIRDMFLGLTEQDFIDIGVDQADYTDMRIAQYKAALLDNATKQSFLSEIVDIGWLDKENKLYGDKLFTKTAVNKAKNFLNTYFVLNVKSTENEAAVLDDIIFDRLTTKLDIESKVTGLTGTTKTSRFKMEFAIDWAEQRNLIKRIIELRNKKTMKPLTGTAEIIAKDQSEDTKKTGVTNTEPNYKAIELHDLIRKHIAEKSTTQITNEKENRSRQLQNINKDFAALSDEDKNFIVNKEGTLLSDYFTDKGKVIIYRTTSAEGMTIFKPTTKQGLKLRDARIKTEAENKEANLKEEKKVKAANLKRKPKVKAPGQAFLTKDDIANKDAAALRKTIAYENSVIDEADNADPYADLEDTTFFRLDGSIIKNPVPILRVRAIVNKALSKLQLKPKATVVKDKAELESKFPELYERAVAGRQQGDFDTTNFAAFALGDEIVVLADNIKTEEQLKFIVAHETLGHFGLRAFVPDGKLNAVLEDLYNSEGHIKAVADMHIKNGMDKYIAIEEAMANAAATLDVSAIQRIWFAIKNFLNKIGIKFDDDLSRYILSQSRRNLRTGGGSYFNLNQLVSNIEDEYDRATQTRFNTEQHNTDLPASVFAMNGITSNGAFSSFGSFGGFSQLIKNKIGLDLPRAIGSALEYMQTLGNISVRNEGLRSIFNIFGMQSKKIKSLERTYETLTQFSTKPNVFNTKYKGEETVTTNEQYKKLIDTDKSGTEAGNVGPTDLETKNAGKLLSFAALYRAKQNGEDSTIEKASSLREIKDGSTEEIINRKAARELEDMGLVTIEEFIEGIPYDISIEDDTGNLESRKFIPEDGKSHGETNEDGFKITPRIYKIYLEMRKAISKSAIDVFESSLDAGKFERQDSINNFLKSVGQDSNLTGARETFILIMDKYKELRQEEAIGSRKTDYTTKAKAKSDLFIREVNRALFEPLKLKDWRDGNAGVGVEQNYKPTDWDKNTSKPNTDAQPIFAFPIEKYARIIEGLDELNAMFKVSKQGGPEANKITNTIKTLFALEEGNRQIEFNSKRTLMTGYVQFARRGKYQVETIAFDKDRKIIKLADQYKNAMPYFQVESGDDARDIQIKVGKIFGKNLFVVKDSSDQEVEVTLEPGISEARTASLMSLDQNLTGFLRIADALGINLSAKDKDKVIKGLTETGSAARNKLPRVGKAGWDPDVVRTQAMYLRAQSHLAGKTYFEHKLNNVISDEKKWLGDRELLDELKETLDRVDTVDNTNEAEKQLARANYDEYANMYRYSAPTLESSKGDITIYEMTGVLANVRTPKQVKPEGRGEEYRKTANDLLAYYGSGDNIVDSTEDVLETSKLGQNLKILAVSSQLGGSVATAIINSMSMVTHSIPFLATYNPKTGYGGGFGISASSAAMLRAVSEMSDGTKTRLGLTEDGLSKSLANLDFMHKVTGYDRETGRYALKTDVSEIDKTRYAEAKLLQDEYNISEDEAQALHRATSDGVLQAAQYNALVGSARGGMTNTTSGFLKKWMTLFSYTEQLNRRATFLAAYRLQKEKLRAGNDAKYNVEGITEERKAELDIEIQGLAAQFAEVAVNTSQGEYSMFNRPKISRGPLLNSIMMYKQFVFISVELMKNLGRNERIYFLALLFLLSGMKGLPFAEDIADLIDTLTQMFGIKMGTVEKELNMFIEEVAPGMSPLVMRGVIDKFSGGTISTRLGFGDLIPLTGIAKAGSDPWRETQNFLGPVWAAGDQTVSALTLLTNWSAEVVGIKDDTTNFKDVLRTQPFGGIRAIADAYSYYDDGVITNKQGKVLDKNVAFHEIFLRALNFYPASASYQNDIIRMTKQTGDYVKSIKAKFSEAYVKARISGDRGEMRRVERAVKNYNRTSKNTEFYLDDWKTSANRMYDAWKLPAAERFKKFATKRSRPDIEKLMEAYDIQ